MRIFPKGPTDADVQARVDAAVATLLSGANFSGEVQAPSLKIDPPPGPDLVTNGNFETSGNWTFGTGWAWTSGAANKNANGWGTLSQSGAIPYADSTRHFRITFTVLDRTTGSVTPQIAGSSGTAVSANGDYEQVISVSWTGGSVSFEASFSARLKVTNVEAREVFPGVGLSYEGIIPSISNAVRLGNSQKALVEVYTGFLNASNVQASMIEALAQIRGDWITALNSYSYTPGVFILGSGWSHGDWRLRVDGDDLVFEQYDDGTWEWIEKYRIPATE